MREALRAGRKPANADDEADGGQEQDFAEHHPEHAAARRAEGHADADFAGPAGDVIGHGGEEPDAGD
jgi:hypothetical protein